MSRALIPSESIALFGGRFDPPHQGHVAFARELLERWGFKGVWVIPSGAPPHKPTVASAVQRLALARLAFEGFDARIRVLDTEVLSDGPSYTWDTLQRLRGMSGGAPFTFALGTDQARNLMTWHRFPEVLGLCHWWVAARRDGSSDVPVAALAPLQERGAIRPMYEGGLGQLLGRWETCAPGPGGETQLVVAPTDAPECSSTAVRASIIRTGTPPAAALPKRVEEYLKLHRLYGS